MAIYYTIAAQGEYKKPVKPWYVRLNQFLFSAFWRG